MDQAEIQKKADGFKVYGYPNIYGRCHDSHIFKSSGFGQQVLHYNIIPSQYHLIGDAAYGLHNVMVPYPATVEIDLTILHNNRHSSNHRCQKYSYSTCYQNFFLANTSQES